jgi:HEAT repeat protein
MRSYMRFRTLSESLTVACLLLLAFSIRSNAQMTVDGVDPRTDTKELARQLASPDANVRQRSAEALAKLASKDQEKLVEGYQLQEKNKQVRLALDWALYRMGHEDALFRVVKDLDSGRQAQAIGYLSDLESPDMLYPFLKKANNPPRVNAGLLKALAKTGNAESLEVVKPFRESVQEYVAEAAEQAYDEIEKRLGSDTQSTRSRPRTVDKNPERP